MYKALYSYEGQEVERTLTFKTDDEFNLIDQVNEHWWMMQTLTGDTGLVPASYLAINKTVKSEILESIDRAIDLIHKNAGKKGGPLTAEERRNLKKLISHRQNVVDDKAVGSENDSSHSKDHIKDYPLPSSQTQQQQPALQQQQQNVTQQSKIIQQQQQQQIVQQQNYENQSREEANFYDELPVELPDQPKRRAPSPPSADCHRQRSQSSISRRKAPAPPSTLGRTASQMDSRNQSMTSPTGNQKNEFNCTNFSMGKKTNKSMKIDGAQENIVCKRDHISSINVPVSLSGDLVSKVMEKLKISESKSQEAVLCVLQGIKDSTPVLGKIMGNMISNLPYLPQAKRSFGPEDELRVILDDLSERKSDSQQRSWALHEDYHSIQSLLTKLLKILAEADKKMCRKVLREDDYHYLDDLVVYYQMEPRIGLRILLIQTFGSCCQLGFEFITQLLCTVLPTELARVLRETENITNFLNVALLMTMLFTTGEDIPLHQYAQLNNEFLDFIFECIERPHIVDEYDQIPYSLVSFLLSFNQHFKEPDKNKILSVMSQRRNLSVFTEKILVLVNRENDPVAIFDYHKPDPNTVIKMLQDIFSMKETANIFFTNDLFVLIDIILRQLTDRCHGDKIRTQFLSLFYDIITNSNYREHRHRCNEFGECFTSILVNEEYNIEDDKYIVRNICSEFNELFPIFI